MLVGLGAAFPPLVTPGRQGPATRTRACSRSTSDYLRAHSSPRRMPVTAANAIAVARTASSLAVEASMSRITSSTAGASTCARLIARGLALPVGWVGADKPHLTARPREACSSAWWRRTEAEPALPTQLHKLHNSCTEEK